MFSGHRNPERRNDKCFSDHVANEKVLKMFQGPNVKARCAKEKK
jgi:hypothetical protein